MPFLGGLFSRKNKSTSRPKPDHHGAASSIHASELDSALSSPTTSYVTHDKSIPTYPNARNLLHPDSAYALPSNDVHPSMTTISLPPPTGKRLRLPFARKKDSLPVSDLSIASSPNVTSPKFDTSPRSSASAMPKANPEDLRRLRPPPSRSAIFAAYGDQTNGHSTHSLPDEASVASEPSLPFPSSSPSPQSSKKTSLFPWSKASSQKSSPNSPLSDSALQTKPFLDPIPPTSLDPAGSFNLKSFRHIRAPSPTHSNTSNTSLTTPMARPRPRGESINSDSSQRISVAAFREAQARRSLAGSPSPSFRASSPVPTLPLQTSSPQAVQLQNSIHPRGRHSSMALSTSDSDSSTSSDDEDETIKRRPGISHSGHNSYEMKNKGKAKSEMGHKSGADDRFIPDSAAPQRAPKSHSGHSWQLSGQSKPGTGGNGLDSCPRSQSSLGHYAPAPKLQSSVSTTPSPSATTKSAGMQGAPTPNLAVAAKPSREPPLSTHSNSQNTTPNVPQKSKLASDSEDDSEDDAPLATLVGPRRPGSAMSSYSSLHARSTGNVTNRSTRSTTLGPTKPLIDINELTGPKRFFTTPVEKSTAGFTEGPTLLSGAKRSISPTSVSTEIPFDLNQPLTRKAPPVKFISPPSSPPKKVRQLIVDTFDGVNSATRSDTITFPSAKPTSPEQPRDALTERLSRAANPKLVSHVGPNISKAKNLFPNHTESLNITVGDTSNSSRQLRSETRDASTKETRVQSDTEKPSTRLLPKVNHSPPDEDLAGLLGTAGIEFMFGSNGAIPDQSSETESEDDEEEDDESYVQVKKEELTSTGNIAPIPIKQRQPAPSFSVTSRPPFPRRDSATIVQADVTKDDATRLSTASDVIPPRPRSITLTPASTSSTSFHKLSANDDIILSVPSNVPPKSTSNIGPSKVKSDAFKPPNIRQRSSTMATGVPLTVQASKAFHVPEKPFAVRRNSPASSTGDSSSGRAPLTPRDGSEIGTQDRKRDEWSGGASGLGVKQHFKRRSVSFEEDNLNSKPLGIPHSKSKEHANNNAAVNDEDREARRKERRRSEAKAAIELGNVINGPAPIVDDEDEMTMTHNINPRMSNLNSMMGMGLPMQMAFGSPNSVAWAGSMGQPMHSPYMMPPPADPNFLAAHQHAMMYAKQAYQMAVAQQAIAAAGDEWERGSTVGGYGGSGMMASTNPGMMSSHFGMMPIGQGYGWPSPSSVYLPSSSRSMFGGPVGGGSGGSIINSRSEYGGSRSPNNWPSSRSSYGESFGPPLDQHGRKNAQNSRHVQRDSVSSLRAPVMPAAQSQTGRGSPVRSGNGQRDSAYLPSVPAMPASQSQSGRGSPDGTPRPRTGSQPASPSRGAYGRKIPPPSSWKAGM